MILLHTQSIVCATVDSPCLEYLPWDIKLWCRPFYVEKKLKIDTNCIIFKAYFLHKELHCLHSVTSIFELELAESMYVVTLFNWYEFSLIWHWSLKITNIFTKIRFLLIFYPNSSVYKNVYFLKIGLDFDGS